MLNEAENIFVLVDEAHRTQYRSLAANMRVALQSRRASCPTSKAAELSSGGKGGTWRGGYVW